LWRTIVEFSLKFNQTIIQQATSLFYLTLIPLYTFQIPPLRCGLSPSPIMPSRSSKNKSAAEKGASAPVTTTAGRQRTLTTKQQLLRKSHQIITFYLIVY
jgi:hypothetical protein